jgi:lysyl-tRNA synthetase class 1
MPEITPETSPLMGQLIGFAITYYRDFILPKKQYRKATPEEKKALEDLRSGMTTMPATATPEDIQTLVYEVGKRHPCFPGLRDWFLALYQILLGQDSGPRTGSFIALLGIEETIELLDRTISGKNLSL